MSTYPQPTRKHSKSRSEENMEVEGTPPRPAAETIAIRAYEIWRAEGCPDGRALDNWLQAENETLAAIQH